MPAAIPLVVGAIASALVPVAWGALAASLIGGLASLAASMIFAKKPKQPDLSSFLNQAGAGRTQQVRQPISSHEIIYGRIKKSGPITFIHTMTDDDGRANGYLYLIHVLAACKIKSIRDIYLNEDFSTASQFSGFVRVNKHLGASDQVADSDLVSEIGGSTWTSNHRGRGMAYIATRLKWDATAFSTGIPNIAAIVDGHDEVYDPRTLATGYSNNAALCIANYLTSSFGFNLAWSRLDEDSLIEAANICDERVPVVQYDVTFTADAATEVLTLASGARSLDWGDGVRLSNSGGALPAGLSAATTYYVIPHLHEQVQLATTAANALAGTAINITDAGTGTHTLTYYDEARYKLNGTFAVDQEVGEVLDNMRSAMAGYVIARGGKWFIHAGAAVTPTFELTDSELAGDIRVEPKRSMRDRINGVRAVFVNPDANWQPDDSPVLKPTVGLLAEDGGEELYGDIRNLFVTSRQQMARLMKIERDRNRQEMTAEASWKFHALSIAPLDTGTITIARYFTEKQFQVMGWGFDETGVQLSMLEDTATIYDWSLDDEAAVTPRPGATLPGGDLGTPVVSVTTPTTPDYYLTITWTEIIGATSYDVEYSDAGAATWVSFGSVTGTSVSILFAEAADLRVRASATSDWGYNYAPAVPTGAVYQSGEVQWTDGVDTDQVQVFGVVDGNLELRGTVASGVEFLADGADPHQIRSVNATGNVSDLVDALPPP